VDSLPLDALPCLQLTLQNTLLYANVIYRYPLWHSQCSSLLITLFARSLQETKQLKNQYQQYSLYSDHSATVAYTAGLKLLLVSSSGNCLTSVTCSSISSISYPQISSLTKSCVFPRLLQGTELGSYISQLLCLVHLLGPRAVQLQERENTLGTNILQRRLDYKII